MHNSSKRIMQNFIREYLSEDREYVVLDLGSQQIEGQEDTSYKSLFKESKYTYIGADIVSGYNVDVVLDSVYNWSNIEDDSYDCVICGQMLEHDEFFWLTFIEIERILKPGGLCCIIAPSSGKEHKYPVDCYRFYPDGLKAAAKFAKLNVIKAYAEWNSKKYIDMDHMWRDCVLIASKKVQCNEFDIKKKKEIYSWVVNNIDSSMNETYTEETDWEFPCKDRYAKVYFDYGQGFSEDDSAFLKVNTSKVLFKVKVKEACRQIRLDPIENSKCIVSDLLINEKKIEEIKSSDNSSVSYDTTMVFVNDDDPQIIIDMREIGENVDTVVFEYNLLCCE